jgi:hypothetical protein
MDVVERGVVSGWPSTICTVPPNRAIAGDDEQAHLGGSLAGRI